MVDAMRTTHGVSIRQGCKAVGLPESTYRYQRRPKADEPIIEALTALVERHPSIGFWQAHHRLRLMGHRWNHKRVYRIYTAMRLNIRRRAKKRLPARVKQRLFAPALPNQVWSLDRNHRDSHARQPLGRACLPPAQCDRRLQLAADRRRSRCSGSRSIRACQRCV